MTREEIDEGWDQLRAEMTKTLGELANTNHLLDTYIVGAAVARIAHMFNIVIAEVDLLRARVKELSALPVTNRIAPENFTGKAIKINGRTCRVLRHDVYLRRRRGLRSSTPSRLWKKTQSQNLN